MRGSTLHAVFTVAWVLATIPTVLWWSESLLWIAFMSIYAIVVSHATGYDAAKSKELQQGEPDTPQ